jgi:hypothetical protein
MTLVKPVTVNANLGQDKLNMLAGSIQMQDKIIDVLAAQSNSVKKMERHLKQPQVVGAGRLL